VLGLSRLAQRALASHSWPGNIRELRNVVFSALVNKHEGDSLLLSDLPRLEPPQPAAGGARLALDRDQLRQTLRRGGFNLRAEIAAFERAALEAALEEAEHSPTAAARLLGEVGHGRARDPGGTVRAMMRRHGIK
jgi:DNA-binding NtrC family response regulator